MCGCHTSEEAFWTASQGDLTSLSSLNGVIRNNHEDQHLMELMKWTYFTSLKPHWLISLPWISMAPFTRSYLSFGLCFLFNLSLVLDVSWCDPPASAILVLACTRYGPLDPGPENAVRLAVEEQFYLHCSGHFCQDIFKISLQSLTLCWKLDLHMLLLWEICAEAGEQKQLF